MIMISSIKMVKSEPLEMGNGVEDLAFCGLKSDVSQHFLKKLEHRLNFGEMVSVRFTRSVNKLEYKI